MVRNAYLNNVTMGALFLGVLAAFQHWEQRYRAFPLVITRGNMGNFTTGVSFSADSINYRNLLTVF